MFEEEISTVSREDRVVRNLVIIFAVVEALAIATFILMKLGLM